MHRSGLLAAAHLVACLFLVSSQAQQSATGTDEAFVQPNLFRPGDAVRISVFPDTALFLNGIYPIDESGSINLPLAGRLAVSSKSEDDLSAFLNTTYVQHLPFPNVQVQYLVRLSFLGGFQRPGLYYVDPRLSLWQALQVTGGPLREDGFKKMKWERDRSVMAANMVPLLESGKSLQQLGFKSGDQVLVTPHPQRNFWETVRTDILPIATFATTSILTGLTIYRLYSDE